jgi:hypothetical protein
MHGEQNIKHIWQRTDITPVLPIEGRRFLRFLRELFYIFRGSSKFLFIHSTFSHGTPEDITRVPGWKKILTLDRTIVKAIGYSVRTVVKDSYGSFPFAV